MYVSMVVCRQNVTLKSVHKGGMCGLCFTFASHLERHHISYHPEVTIDLCHNCHFKATFNPRAFNQCQLRILLSPLYKHETILKYEGKLLELYDLRRGSQSRRKYLESQK